MIGRHVLVLTILLLLFLTPSLLPIAPARASPATYTLYSAYYGWGFTPGFTGPGGPDLYAYAGETVNLTLIGVDQLFHNFVVDYNGTSNRNWLPDPGEPVSPGYFNETQDYSFAATATPGTYTYYCLVHHSTGSFGRLIVMPNQLPTAAFTFQPATPFAGNQVSFNASSSQDPDGTIVDYTWNFGDGAIGSGKLANHTFTAAGTYAVTLRVMDNNGARISNQQTVAISGPPNTTAPVANFTFSPNGAVAGTVVAFDASGSYDVDTWDRVSLYTWDFGDGNTTSTASPLISHRYFSGGTFTVILNVADSLLPQMTGRTQETVTVAPAIHDVAVVSVTTGVGNIRPGEIVLITVVVRNDGTLAESFSISLYYNSTAATGRQIVSSLYPGSEFTITFRWNTVGVAPAKYAILAIIENLPGETDTADNAGTLPYLVSIQASGPSPSSNIFGLPPALFVGVLVALIISAAVLGLYFRKWRTVPPDT